MSVRSSNEVAAREALRRLGTTLSDRYHITRLIGMGGMAAVYAGRHRNGHPVAIKVLHRRFFDDETGKGVRREARLANEVAHPAVVPVIDDDVTTDGCVFLVMPLLDGETLRARASRTDGKLPIDEVVLVAHALLGALSAAHARKVVHRDLKPENVFVTRDGAIRLLDFGIGRLFGDEASTHTTYAGRAVGTPAFMAPEQALGRTTAVDGRTDLWGLGATMFSLLSGRPVHDGATSAETIAIAATATAPPLGDVAPEVPAPLRAVVDRALAFAQEGRWESADAMDRALVEGFEHAFARTVRSIPPLVVPAQPTGDSIDVASTAAGTDEPGVPVATTKAASLHDGPAGTARTAAVRRRWPKVGGALVMASIVLAVAASTRQARRGTVAGPPLLVGDVAAGDPTTVPPPVPSVAVTAAVAAPPLAASVHPVVATPDASVSALSPASKPVRAAVGTAPPPIVSSPSRGQEPKSGVPRVPPPPPPTAVAPPNCDPPYTIDSAGHHAYKVECNQ